MSRRGRPRAATPAQVEQVRSLAAEALSERKIAKLVFGDARYRGRVERILRPARPSSTRDPVDDEHSPFKSDKGFEEDGPEPSIRDLVIRHRQRLTGQGDLPSLKEIELLLKLERELDTQETLERLNALTREVR